METRKIPHAQTIRSTASERPSGSPGCPLSLWRTRTPTGIGPADVTALARAVAGIALLRERRWPAARAGDPAAAAAVALACLRGEGLVGPSADVAMSNLVLLARRDDDPTARVVLAHGLRSLARRRPERARLIQLADAWARWSPTDVPGDRRGRRP